MTDAELLTKIKNGLNITGDFQDETLSVYIENAKEFMKSAGVKESVITSPASVGCILQGVSDLWVEKRSDFSNVFKMRVVQLALKKE